MESADTTIHAPASTIASGANSCSAAKVHTVAVTGSTGLVGKALCEELRKEGYHVIRLLREGARGLDDRIWNPTNPDPDILNGIDALIHLAGESTEGIWKQDKKRRIRDSRVIPTRKLAELVAQSDTVHTFICASAISIYGDSRGAEVLTEVSAPGDGFFADVVQKWEGACQPVRAAGKRVVNVRTGIVLSRDGGVLPLLVDIFNWGGGGLIGMGKRWMSWIDIDDLTRIYAMMLTCDTLEGPVNATSPEPCTNSHFTKALGVVLDRPTGLIIPAIASTMVGHQGARQLAMSDQRAQPRKLQDLPNHGFFFRYRTIEQSLYHQLPEDD